jgi:hypothetical protein
MEREGTPALPHSDFVIVDLLPREVQGLSHGRPPCPESWAPASSTGGSHTRVCGRPSTTTGFQSSYLRNPEPWTLMHCPWTGTTSGRHTPTMLQLSVELPWHIPTRLKLLYQPRSDRFNPDPETLSLHACQLAGAPPLSSAPPREPQRKPPPPGCLHLPWSLRGQGANLRGLVQGTGNPSCLGHL